MVSLHSTAPEGDTPSDANSRATGAPRAANRLADETSPYLLQHAHNPVDWYPWGAEALERARAEDKPILLSIGYSACHWCHVMERESFEDPRTAALMNAVVRQHQGRSRGAARPRRHLHAGRAGDDRQRRLADDRVPDARRHPVLRRDVLPARPIAATCPAFTRVLRGHRRRLAEPPRRGRRSSGAQLREHLQQAIAPTPAPARARRRRSWTRPARGLAAQHDAELRRLRRRAQVPAADGARVPAALLAAHAATEAAATSSRTRSSRWRAAASTTSWAAAFTRYSTDDEWLVPHFEKMLYDNAQLARVYLMAYQATGQRVLPRRRRGDPRVRPARHDRSVGRLLLDRGRRLGGRGGQVLRLDARRGARRCSATEDARLFGAFYDVKPPGNFEGRASILHVRLHAAEVAPRLGVTEARLLAGARARSPGAVRGARAAGAAGARRKGAGGLERHDAARAGRGGARARARRFSGGGRARTPSSCCARCARRTAPCIGRGSPATRRI